eukprot:COSAG02_NODE_1403_length_12811_cov_8.982536_9_plen_283_part_00
MISLFSWCSQTLAISSRVILISSSPSLHVLLRLRLTLASLSLMIGFFTSMPIHTHLANLHCNATAAVEITHHFIGRMQAEGRPGGVAFTSSPASFMATPFTSMYGSTKAFLSEFGASIAPEIKSHGIDVCVVHPSPTDSNFYGTHHKLSLRSNVSVRSNASLCSTHLISPQYASNLRALLWLETFRLALTASACAAFGSFWADHLADRLWLVVPDSKTVTHTIDAMDFFKKTACSPEKIAEATFASLGRIVILDQVTVLSFRASLMHLSGFSDISLISCICL